MKIVILDAATLTINNDIDFSIFDRFGEVKIYDFTKDEEIPERIKDADVILCNKSSMSEKNLSGAKNLKYIGLFATGYNNVDLEYTRKHGITVCNAGSYSTEAVAQHVFAFILHYYNTISRYDEFVKNKGWINTNKFSPFMEMKELFGKTIGIIGYGSIGQKVAVIANAFGMNVLAYSRSALKEKIQSDEVTYAAVDEILGKSDIVTIHCPLNKDSEKMCNKEFFTKMKKDSLFINTSRGGVVNQEDLMWALNNNVIQYAALDVIEKEPMPEDCKLIETKNLVITPHAAWAPLETRERLIKIVSKNLQKWVAGTPINVIE
ncbi:NAD(P)-dependent oxidoreductase [Eubacterium sp.]|jgi:glycerate dehydrogenase|uniref:NAD(P)-dependent oxidoreductase n=2 Tax=Eubacterium TaxID=1730 RepID=UPI001DBEC5FC|nr:NAD(P)-dependent oxidoreductase [Eubacterium sp.]MBS5619914.1 D-2-hydroxyacid dehydrogenase [Eubacterium sp.]